MEKTLWLVDWEDLSVVTDTFEKAVAYVEEEAERIGVKDTLTTLEEKIIIRSTLMLLSR